MTEVQQAASNLKIKLEAKGDFVPAVVVRAMNDPTYGLSSNDNRKLLGHMIKEFEDQIKGEREAMFIKNTDARKKLQEEARKEMNQSKVYDYSKYVIPNLKNLKKSRQLPLQPQSTNSEASNINLPTGSSVLEANSKTYMKNLQKQQARSIKLINQKEKRPARTLVPLG